MTSKAGRVVVEFRAHGTPLQLRNKTASNSGRDTAEGKRVRLARQITCLYSIASGKVGDRRSRNHILLKARTSWSHRHEGRGFTRISRSAKATGNLHAGPGGASARVAGEDRGA